LLTARSRTLQSVGWRGILVSKTVAPFGSAWKVRQEASDAEVLACETPGDFVQLRSPHGLALRVRLRARVGPVEHDPRQWRVRIVKYQYALLDRDGREYLGYHWHPDGVSHVTEPHLHLGPAAQVGVAMLAAAHMPTGTV
jgi:hypothetical protein